MAGGKASVKKINIAQRRKRALQLRIEGATYRRIAEELGVSLHQAHVDVLTELADIPREEADRLRRIEEESLQELESHLWRLLVGGDASAADKILRVKERRARMLGLDAPTKTDVLLTPYSNLSDEELDARLNDVAAKREGSASGGRRETRG